MWQVRWTKHNRARPLNYRSVAPPPAHIHGDALSTFKLSVGRACPVHLLDIEGLLTEGWRAGRTFGDAVGGILEMDNSDGSRFGTIPSIPDPTLSLRTVPFLESARQVRKNQL
jgi:hypothetical protein